MEPIRETRNFHLHLEIVVKEQVLAGEERSKVVMAEPIIGRGVAVGWVYFGEEGALSDYALAFRHSVKGSVALMATSDQALYPELFAFKSSRRNFHHRMTDQDVPSCLEKLERSLIKLTQVQGGQGCFILRAFRLRAPP